MKKFLYFAYGSNLNIEQMKIRCPGAVGISPAVLEGWKLAERIYADIEKAPGECVNGALYEISDFAALDRFEGYPQCYDREEVMVTDNSGTYRKAWVYRMTEECARQREHISWPDHYRSVCFAGAEYWGIPNAFADVPDTGYTLWQEGIPDVSTGIGKMLEFLASGQPLPKAKKLWVGARIIISLKPQNIQDFGFYPAPFEIITPYAQELSWIFNDLRDIFNKENLLNSMNKLFFYGELAECAAEKIRCEVSARDLCRAVVERAKEIYKEMK